ncbi:translation initiation factor [Trema orientale]|uniref:Translation initiation factor n=1 Tax=Trema orientale TaxID=63057 RepID=A0A2P5AJS9_TREOI|nr:translation initiation factor [Trema orientale]
MGRRRVKKTTAKQAPSSPGGDLNEVQVKESEQEKQGAQFADPDVERQTAAIRAIRDVEIEHLLTDLRLLRSYFNKEQLQTPVLQYFAENFPNLSVVRNGENRQAEVQWKTEADNVCEDNRRELHASLLRRLSMAYSDYSAAIPSLGGFDFSSKAVKTSLFSTNDLQIRDFVLEEPSETQMLGMQDAFRTPGMSSQRLSIGMTPKTLRLPKPGEMLLSVRGSPLGVYKEDNMEAIHDTRHPSGER